MLVARPAKNAVAAADSFQSVPAHSEILCSFLKGDVEMLLELFKRSFVEKSHVKYKWIRNCGDVFSGY